MIRASFEKQPATTIAEACERIFQLTGLRRGPSQVRKFLKDLGLKFYRVRAIPVPPTKNLAEHVADQAAFLETKLKPVLAAAQAGEGHVFFVDAAHFVFGTFLCYLWSFTRIFVRAASGRQRFNVLGAWNAVTRHLIAVTNTTVVNTETMSELLRKIAALGLTGAITLVLDNARYQHNAAVKALASQLGITLLFLPSYSPNLNLIERLWKFTKRRALYGRYHLKFANFQAAIQEILDGIPTTYAQQLETLMTLNFQQFEDVSLWPRKVYVPDVTEGITRVEDLPQPRIKLRSRNFSCRRCPFCGGRGGRWGVASRTVHDLGDPLSGRPIDLHICYSTHRCLACRRSFPADQSDLAPLKSQYTHRVQQTAVRLVIEDDMPYRMASWHLWRDHRVFSSLGHHPELGRGRGGKKAGPSLTPFTSSAH